MVFGAPGFLEDDGKGGKSPIDSKVRNVALALFAGCLCFAGAVVMDILTLAPQAVVLGVMGLGGLIYLVAGIYHACMKIEEGRVEASLRAETQAFLEESFASE